MLSNRSYNKERIKYLSNKIFDSIDVEKTQKLYDTFLERELEILENERKSLNDEIVI